MGEEETADGDVIKIDTTNDWDEGDWKLFQKRIKEPQVGDGDNRIAVVFVGDGGSQNGRLPEILNACSNQKLPLLVVIIDNGRAINTFTKDVASNTLKYTIGEHYEIPGVLVDGCNAVDVAKTGKAVADYVRSGNGPAVMQVHTYRFMGHSPADPEHERGRKDEKAWAKKFCDPILEFEKMYIATGVLTRNDLDMAKKEMKQVVQNAVKFAEDSPDPPANLAKELEYPTAIDTDYNNCDAPSFAAAVTERTVSKSQMQTIMDHLEDLRSKARAGDISIAEAVNLAIHEEMLRDPTTTCHAEDLQAGSSYNIPKLTQQTYGSLRASDEIIDEGHFIGKGIGEAMNGYRPIIELSEYIFTHMSSSWSDPSDYLVFLPNLALTAFSEYKLWYLRNGRDRISWKHVSTKWWSIQITNHHPGCWRHCTGPSSRRRAQSTSPRLYYGHSWLKDWYCLFPRSCLWDYQVIHT